MKITILGSSHGDPTPFANQTSVLLEINGKNYLIDAGEGANSSIVRRNFTAADLSAIFITHMHIDHSSSLPVLIEQFVKNRGKNLEKYGKCFLNVALPDPRAKEAVKNYLIVNSTRGFVDNNGFEIVRFDDITSSYVYNDNNVKFSFIPTKHLAHAYPNEERSFSILVEAEGKKVLFTGDLSASCADFPFEKAKECDLLFSEFVHFKPESLKSFFADLGKKKVVLYHLATRWQDDKGKEELLNLFSDLDCEVTRSYDGYSIEL